MKKYTGVTLIELIIVMVVLSILTVVSLPMLQSGFNAYLTQKQLTDANWQSRLIFARMTRDIENIPSTGNITTAAVSQLTFLDASNNSVSYTLSGSTLLRNGITLANGVNSVTFGYYASDGTVTGTVANIRYISVVANVTQNNTNLTMSTVLNLRDVI